MTRILVLEDNPARLRWFQRILGPGNNLTLTETAPDAIARLAETLPTADHPAIASPYDHVYLDHDLGDETYADSSRPDTGFEVVRWMVEHRPSVAAVTVHSLNTPAANRMVDALREAGYEADYVPFTRLIHI